MRLMLTELQKGFTAFAFAFAFNFKQTKKSGMLDCADE
jgi:hypothetical protein